MRGVHRPDQRSVPAAPTSDAPGGRFTRDRHTSAPSADRWSRHRGGAARNEAGDGAPFYGRPRWSRSARPTNFQAGHPYEHDSSARSRFPSIVHAVGRSTSTGPDVTRRSAGRPAPMIAGPGATQRALQTCGRVARPHPVPLDPARDQLGPPSVEVPAGRCRNTAVWPPAAPRRPPLATGPWPTRPRPWIRHAALHEPRNSAARRAGSPMGPRGGGWPAIGDRTRRPEQITRRFAGAVAGPGSRRGELVEGPSPAKRGDVGAHVLPANRARRPARPGPVSGRRTETPAFAESTAVERPAPAAQLAR